MGCCCDSSGGGSALPIMAGGGAPVSPPDLNSFLPIYRDLTTGHLWLWSGGLWVQARVPVGWMIEALAPLPLQDSDFITINRGGTPGNPDDGTYYVATIQDLAAAVGTVLGATVVQSSDAAIGVSASGSTYTVTFNPQGGAAKIANDATALSTLFGAATLGMLSDVSSSAPANNDVLVWNGSQWVPTSIGVLTNDSFVNNGSITGGGTTLTLTYNTASLPPVSINVAGIVPNYDNTTSGLSSTNMQAAIDELAAMFGAGHANIGTGQPVFAGMSGGQAQLNSIGAGPGVSVSLAGGTITVQFDPASLQVQQLRDFASMLAGDGQAMQRLANGLSLDMLADVQSGAADGQILVRQGGQWVPSSANLSGGQDEVLVGLCADCFSEIETVVQPGDYWLETSGSDRQLFQWDGANLNKVIPAPKLFVCCNTEELYRNCGTATVPVFRHVNSATQLSIVSTATTPLSLDNYQRIPIAAADNAGVDVQLQADDTFIVPAGRYSIELSSASVRLDLPSSSLSAADDVVLQLWDPDGNAGAGAPVGRALGTDLAHTGSDLLTVYNAIVFIHTFPRDTRLELRNMRGADPTLVRLLRAQVVFTRVR